MKRRKFLKNSSLSTAGILSASSLSACETEKKPESVNEILKPIAIATNKAWQILSNAGSALDAVEQGVMIEEADIENQSVGKGGRPEREGNVTLDAFINVARSYIST